MTLYVWERDKSEILRKLSSPAPLKLCVKTLNEPSLIEGWIRHHAAIVGPENLIIADNASTDPDALRVYESHSEAVTIFQFEGPHNQIHWHPRFADLFRCIKDTCRYFSFVDVDERLVWIDVDSWCADRSLVDQLGAFHAVGIIPATWLINKMNVEDTFTLLDQHHVPVLENNLRWGSLYFPRRWSEFRLAFTTLNLITFCSRLPAVFIFSFFILPNFPDGESLPIETN